MESVGVEDDDDEEDGKEDEREHLPNSDGCERSVKFDLKKEVLVPKQKTFSIPVSPVCIICVTFKNHKWAVSVRTSVMTLFSSFVCL